MSFLLQIITEYNDATLPAVLQAVERMSQHLTAAVVSNDRLFQQQVGSSPASVRGVCRTLTPEQPALATVTPSHHAVLSLTRFLCVGA